MHVVGRSHVCDLSHGDLPVDRQRDRAKNITLQESIPV